MGVHKYQVQANRNGSISFVFSGILMATGARAEPWFASLFSRSPLIP